MKIKSFIFIGCMTFISHEVIAQEHNPHDKHNQATYRIEMHNQTENQWLSPCLCALHNNRVRLFQTGQAATTGQATFSEDGFNGVLAEELRDNPDVYAVLECDAGLTPPGAYRVEHISGPGNARLTCAAMPVTTNDVLTAVDRVKPPKNTNDTHEYASTEWDLGSEHNNYSADFMPQDSHNLAIEGPDNPVTIADNVIFGINGRPIGVPSLLSPFARSYMNQQGDTVSEGTMSIFTHYEGSDAFPAEIYGWSGPASRFTVTRVE